MKTFTFIKRVGFGALFTLITFDGFSQNKTFDVKKHKDTLLNKSGLNAPIINGNASEKSFLMKQPFGNLQNSISSAFALSKTQNLRQRNAAEVWQKKQVCLFSFLLQTTQQMQD